MAKRDLYQEITDSVIESLESGAADPKGWECPWTGGGDLPRNAVTRKGYRGINIVHLWISGASRGYSSPRWASYKQWQSIGASVNRGEKGTAIVFYKSGVSEDAETGEEKRWMVLRHSTVFNAEQVSGDPRTIEDLPADPPAGATREEWADQVIAATGARIDYGGSRACYAPHSDAITIPVPADFHSTEGFYSTVFHELGHWTGHKSRLDRDLASRFGDRKYAAEELVAELAAAFVCGALGISAEPREDHAHYIANWLQVLRADKKAIFTAAARAMDAADYVRGEVAAEVTPEQVPATV